MPPKTVPAFNMSRLCFGALLGSERRQPFPTLLDSLAPPGYQSPARINPRRRSPSDECGNPRHNPGEAIILASYSVARLLPRGPSLSLRRAPSLSLSPGFALPAVARAPPRNHPARRVADYPLRVTRSRFARCFPVAPGYTARNSPRQCEDPYPRVIPG